MGLNIYNDTDALAVLSDNNKFRVTFDGRVGGAIVQCIYLRNDNANYWYDSIQLAVVDTEGDDLVDGSVSGYSWKLADKDIVPSELEWGRVQAGNTLTFTETLGSSSSSDIVTYLPVWVRVEVPAGIAIQTITDIVFRLTASEYLIDG